MAKKPEAQEDTPRVKLTLHIDEADDYVLEGIVRERKRTDRGFSKSEYFRELMRKDPAFISMSKKR